MGNQWFKFYGGEYLSDPKIERLSPLERSCWLTLLCLASMSSDKEGTIQFLTVESLLNKSGIQFDPYRPEEWEKALSVLKKFASMNMIEIKDDGNIFIKNWAKRQESHLTNAERQARFRNKHSNSIILEKTDELVTEQSYESNARIEENRIEKREESSILELEKPSKELLEEMTLKFKCTEPEVRTKANTLADYCRSKGKKYKNYKAFLSNALRKDFGERPPRQKQPIYDMSDGKTARIIGYK